MSNARSLVQAYLHVNGYFAVADFPLLRSRPPGGVRLVTDLDLLAFRLAGSGCEPAWTGSRGITAASGFEPDPALCCPEGEPDMLVVDVGNGQPRWELAGRDPAALASSLARFGCCGLAESADIVRTLLIHGSARTDCGYMVRLAAFEAAEGDRSPGLHIPIAHVARFVRRYLDDNWDVLRHAEWRGGVLGLMAALKRAGLAWEIASEPDAAQRVSVP